MSEIRIMLVDDQAIVREGLRSALERQPDMTVVGEADCVAQAVAVARSARPTLAVVDIRMSPRGGADILTTLRGHHPELAIVAFTTIVDAAQVRESLTAGASGYLLKDASRDEIIHAIRSVASGHAWMHPAAQRQVLDWMRRPASPIENLTTRERSVLRLLAEGRSNKYIATELSLTEGTVKGYVSQILHKLRVNDRTQAALVAHREGFAGRV